MSTVKKDFWEFQFIFWYKKVLLPSGIKIIYIAVWQKIKVKIEVLVDKHESVFF